MIKALIKNKAKDIAFIGFSHQDLEKLRDGQPICINGANMGLPNDVVLKVSATDIDLMKDMRTMDWGASFA